MNNLNALHVFMAVYQTGSTQKAAAQLGRSQSYVSKVLATLREDLNDPLFIRTSIYLSPTHYAHEIAPKLENALKAVHQSLQTEQFSPAKITRISIHMIEAYIGVAGKEIINPLRQHTDAEIDLKCWSHTTEGLILNEKVDLGFHVFKDRPQTFHQTPLVNVSARLVGKENTELVRYVSPGINEPIDQFRQYEEDDRATIFIDHCGLLSQLMEDYQTYYHFPVDIDCQDDSIPQVTFSLIMKTSQKESAKNQWLKSIISPILSRLNVCF